MEALDGIWRLVESRAQDASGKSLGTPYGANPMGTLLFAGGRVLTSICNGDAGAAGSRNFSSYGGPYTFDGQTLVTRVDVASDPARIGGEQVRHVEMRGGRMILRPPTRAYGGSTEQRELVWEQAWRPG